MKILWVKTDFLHPTTRGGQIRTLEMVKRLHARHELHYLTLDDGNNAEGRRRASEYSTRQYVVPHVVPAKTFACVCRATGHRTLCAPASGDRTLPVAAMRRKISQLIRSERFDSVVCDFLRRSELREPRRLCAFSTQRRNDHLAASCAECSGPAAQGLFRVAGETDVRI